MVEEESTIIKCKFEYTKNYDESNFDILSKIDNWANFEESNLIDDMPHLGAVIELWELISECYGVSVMEEVVESIMDRTSDFNAYNDFVDKYNLQKQGWCKFRFAFIDAPSVKKFMRHKIVELYYND